MVKNIKYIGFVLLLFMLPGVETIAHPFYVSVTEIHKNETNQTLEISIKLFVDDFELGLAQYGHEKLQLGEGNASAKADSIINAYLKRNFSLKGDERDLNYHYLGKQLEQENMYLFVEVPDVFELEELEVSNFLLCDVYETQTNIIHYNLPPDEVLTLMLSKGKSSGVFRFE